MPIPALIVDELTVDGSAVDGINKAGWEISEERKQIKYGKKFIAVSIIKKVTLSLLWVPGVPRYNWPAVENARIAILLLNGERHTFINCSHLGPTKEERDNETEVEVEITLSAEDYTPGT